MMKKLLLLSICLLLVSSVALADHIGVYSDPTGSSCYLGAAGQFNPNATVIHKFTSGATGSRFKVTFPAGTAFFAFNTTYVPIGALDTDLSLGYGQCLSGEIVLGSILAIYGAGTGQVEKADLQPIILYTNCVFAELLATGGAFTVGQAGYCTEYSTPVESSTWGSVKALYR
jgi:hypothetical protein